MTTIKVKVMGTYVKNGVSHQISKIDNYSHYDPVINPAGKYSTTDYSFLKQKSLINQLQLLKSNGYQNIQCNATIVM